ncbi:MAG: esterase-like activity of phytase family protein [Pseudomonadota bacterium]
MFRRLGLALSLLPACALAQTATLEAQLALRSELPGFGGLSAVELSEDGTRAHALSDRGAAFSLILVRKDGRLTDAQVSAWNGPVIAGDSEGLAIGAGKSVYSTEGPAGLRETHGSALPDHPDFADFPLNAGFEALAVAPDGTLWAIPEARDGGVLRTYLYAGGWARGPDILATEGFRPSGADFGPDGWLYLLERRVTTLGFQARVRQIDPATGDAKELLRTAPSPAANFEGIGVWQDQAGTLRLTLIADNNFIVFVENRFVEYVLTPLE